MPQDASRAARSTDAAAPGGGRAQTGTWGLDLTSLDTTVEPGDDFYRFANGKWLDARQIPQDRTSWGAFIELADRAEVEIRAIAESLPKEHAPEGSTEQKAGDFYRAYLDTATIDSRGLAPAQPGLDAITAARTHEQVADLMGRPDLGIKSPLALRSAPTRKTPIDTLSLSRRAV